MNRRAECPDFLKPHVALGPVSESFAARIRREWRRGRHYGYPVCCTAFFTLIFDGLFRLSFGPPERGFSMARFGSEQSTPPTIPRSL
jgi:hypothetical protein